MLTETELLKEAEESGFQRDPLEKALHLLELLDLLCRHPFLKSRIALKGGTALNLFVFYVPRLSVDVDLNYIGSSDRETMLRERPKVEQAVQAVCSRMGVQVKRVPSDHAGGKWRLSYTGVSGLTGTLELDMNFLLRTPLWTPARANSRNIAGTSASEVPVLDIHELAAGKLAALFDRTASRDLFDARHLLRDIQLDRERLRLGFVVYGGISRKDWRTVSLDDVNAEPRDVERSLLPMLRADVAPSRETVAEWTTELVAECRQLLGDLLPLRANELEFTSLLNEQAAIEPSLLTTEHELQDRIATHPGLLWKALNVREHRGLTGG